MPRSFPFKFARPYRLAALPLGITPATARVDVDDDTLRVRFGPWKLRTPLHNIAAVSVTGPYGLAKTIGPPHLSFSDRGVTFATNGEQGVCIRFVEPVPAIEATGRLRHPGATVTVADVEGLAALLRRVTTVRSVA